MYFLISTLLPGRRIGAIAGGLFYMMNPYSLVYIWGQLSGFVFAYAFQPLLLALFIRGLESKRQLLPATVLTVTWWATAGNAYGNPELFAINVLPLVVYFVAHLLLHNQRDIRIRATKFAALLFVVWIGVNAYWVFPWAFFLNEAYQAAAYLQLAGSTDLSAFQGNSVPMVGAIRLLGYWAINSGNKGDPYYVWAGSFASPVLTLLSFLLPSIAFSPLILRPRSKRLLTLASFAIGAIFLVKGSDNPGGGLLEYILSGTSLLRIFRAPYQRFGIDLVLGYGLLIGIAVGIVSTWRMKFEGFHGLRIRRLRQVSFGTIVAIMIIVIIAAPLAWPFWTGDVIYPGGAVIPSARVSVPPYYSDAAKWLSVQNEDFNVLAVPLQLLGGTTLSWSNNTEGYLAINPDERLLPKPMIYSWQQFGSGLPGIIMNRLFIYNSGFETGDLSGWTVNGATATVQDNTVFQGAFAAVVQLAPSSHADFFLTQAYEVSGFPQPLNFSIYLRGQGNAVNSQLTFWFYNDSGYIGSTQSTASVVSNEWTLRSFTAASIIGATNFRIGVTFDSQSGGTVFVDKIGLAGVARIENLAKLLSYLNVKYVVYNEDTNWNYVKDDNWWIPSTPNETSTLFRSIPGLALDQSFDKLVFYRNTLWSPMHLWATMDQHLVSGGFDQLLTAIQESTGENSVFFMTSQLNSAQTNLLSQQNLVSPGNFALRYQRVSPVQYTVQVNATGPFFLVFSENFHSDWRAYIGKVDWLHTFTAPSIPDIDHFEANGFANAWYVRANGAITITVYFWPQNVYYVGVGVSIATITICMCLIIAGYRRSKQVAELSSNATSPSS